MERQADGEAAKARPSPHRPPKRRRLDLGIVLDTNVIFSESPTELLSSSIKGLIGDTQSHSDVAVRWYVPEMVLLERRYQILEVAERILPNAVKIHQLLGLDLGVSRDTLEERVEGAIAKRLEESGVEVIRLATTDVDWPRLIQDAAHRRAPFQKGEKEKGFRDAIVGETFLQLVASSPKSPSICRLTLVTGDELLAQAVEQRCKEQHVKVARNLDELKDQINLLVANVTNEFVASIRPAADDLFFGRDMDDGKSIWHREDIWGRIKAVLKRDLVLPPEAKDFKIESAARISTRFAKKEKARIHWTSGLSVDITAQRDEVNPDWAYAVRDEWSALKVPDLASQAAALGLIRPAPAVSLSASSHDVPRSVLSMFLGATKARKVASGTAVVEVDWSATIKEKDRLVRASLQDVRLVGDVAWETPPSAAPAP